MIASYLVIILLAVSSEAGWDEVKTLSEASIYCSWRVFYNILMEEQTLVYSPYSIHSALSMALLGAREETAKEMAEVLSLGTIEINSLPDEYEELNEKLSNVNDVELYTANALFANPSINIEEAFINDAKTYYQAVALNFDLKAEGGPEKIINDFVDEKTKGQIKTILEPGSIDDKTALIIVNTIFFNGTWLQPFPKYNTKEQDFKLFDGKTSKMDFMFDYKLLNFKRFVNGNSLLELAFQGNRFALYVFLPDVENSISVSENNMRPRDIEYMVSQLKETSVTIKIPKFRIDSEFKLKKDLQVVGMVKAFDDANFKGISKSGGLYISEVIHKAMIEVCESGTVASAATAVSLLTRSATKERFIADHPFIFFLRDKETKQVLFQGKFSG